MFLGFSPVAPEIQVPFFMSMEGRYTENAGAVFWDVHGRTVHRKRRSSFLGWPWKDGTQKTQEQLFWDVHGRTVHRKRRSCFLGWTCRL